jgi:hypothetical protein
VSTYIWSDDKFPFANDDVQLVWFHIFTNPLSSPLGVFRASLAGLAEDKNRNGRWPMERYLKAFGEAKALGFVDFDPKALLIGFPNYFSAAHKCNHPTSPNVLKAWAKRFNDLPDSPLKFNCFYSLQAITQGIGAGMAEAFRYAFGDGYALPSPNTDPNPYPEPEPKPEPKEGERIKSSAVPSVTAAPWEAYRITYERRYKVAPVRNAKVNGQLAQLVKRLGLEDATHVAAFSVTHNEPFYVRKRHPVDLLLRDCEGLRTQWATGQRATTREARAAEQADNVTEQVARVRAALGGTHGPR